MLILETNRLILRNFHLEDWEALLDLAIRYQASDYAQYDHPWPTSEEEVKGMAAWFAKGDDFFAVCLKSTGALIGLLNIQHKKDAEQREHGLGYVFHPDYYHQGYATEACRAGMAQVFGPWQADLIRTGTHPNNKPSVGLLHKLGLNEVGAGEYTITRDEWLSKKEPIT